MSAEVAAAALAALAPGENRIATAVLLERLGAAFPGLSGVALGKALTAAGWTAEQWRTPQGRVRGYAPPASGRFAVTANQRQSSGKAAPARTAPPTPEFSPPAGLGGRAGTRDGPGACHGLHGPEIGARGCALHRGGAGPAPCRRQRRAGAAPRSHAARPALPVRVASMVALAAPLARLAVPWLHAPVGGRSDNGDHDAAGGGCSMSAPRSTSVDAPGALRPVLISFDFLSTAAAADHAGLFTGPSGFLRERIPT